MSAAQARRWVPVRPHIELGVLMGYHRLRAAVFQSAFPLLRGYSSGRQYRVLKRLQWMKASSIRVKQQSMLEESLASWRREIPFYRDCLARAAADNESSVETLCADMIDNLELTYLPIMNKQLFMEHSRELCYSSPSTRLLRSNHTGGSTGQVFHFLQNHIDSRWSAATHRLHHDFIGVSLNESSAKIWGASLDADTGMREALAYRLANSTFISTYNLDPSRIDTIVDQLVAANPVLLTGYPTSISVFARRMSERKIRLPRLRAVWSASETLFPVVRDQLEEELCAPVYNNYGSREFGGLAMECTRREGLHLNDGCYLFEYKKHAEGLYALLVTDLHNRIQPLIRYEIGDLVRRAEQPCSCGRGHGLLSHVEGRTFDLIHGPNGEVVTGTFWTLVLRSKPGIRQFQVVQETPDRFRIKLVTDSNFQLVHLQEFEEHIQNQFHTPVDIRWERVDDIPPMPSGKFRFIISCNEKNSSSIPVARPDRS